MRSAGWLRVRTTRVVGGDEVEEARGTVFCPFETRSKTLDECRQCEFCDGVSFDPEGGPRSLARCSRDLAEAPAQDPEPHAAPVHTPAATLPIAGILRRETVCVRPETDPEELAALFLEKGISGAPVVDDAGRVIGVVTKTDLVRLQRNPSLEPQTARDIMAANPITIQETAPISRAAAVMAFEGIHRLPVVDDRGVVVGLVSAVDILRWLARNDGFRLPEYTQGQRP